MTPFLAVLSSSLVACCCKHGVAFMHWSVIGGVLFVLHVIAAIVAVAEEAADTARFSLVFLVQILLCGVNLLVVHRGCKTASAILRQLVSPVQSQIGTPLQLSAHPVAGVQQHSPVVHVLP